jgi:hypothetical protein
MKSKSIPKFKLTNRYPNFMHHSGSRKVLEKYARQPRIWPKIGLRNCRSPIRYNGRDCEIVFSGSGLKAVWDIATMSQRGIYSCQSWDGSYRTRLIGSMVDPFLGIMYITDGARNAYGKQMLARALVRFVISKAGKASLLIERMYGAATYETFSAFLREKTGNKFPIDHVYVSGWRSFIPRSAAVKQLPITSISYRDSRVPYLTHPKYDSVQKVAKEIKSLETITSG